MKEQAERSEQEWVALLQADGRPEAWGWLNHRVHDPLMHLGQRMGLSHEEAEEAVQETLVAFHGDLREGRFDPGKGSLFSWVWRLGRWKCIEQHRRRPLDLRRRADVLEDRWAEESEPTWGSIPSDGDPRMRWMAAALAELPRRVSPLEFEVFTALVLRREDGETAARRLGITRNSAYLHKRHALQRLRACVEELRAAEPDTPGA